MSRRIRPNKTMIILSGMVVLGAIGLHSAFSGDLEPTAAPGPTMYTLEEIYNFRVWKMSGKTFINHPGNSRFAVHDPATPGDEEDDLVLDKDTGLIWARVPGPSADIWTAVLESRDLDLGDRKGWRLPTVEELSSLLDMNEDSPALPSGHPFVGVENEWYWTDPPSSVANYTFENDEEYIYVVHMGNGDVSCYGDEGEPETYVWPVWGGRSSGL